MTGWKKGLLSFTAIALISASCVEAEQSKMGTASGQMIPSTKHGSRLTSTPGTTPAGTIAAPILSNLTSGWTTGDNPPSWQSEYDNIVIYDGSANGDEVRLRWQLNGGSYTTELQPLNSSNILSDGWQWPTVHGADLSAGGTFNAQEQIAHFVAGVETGTSAWSNVWSDVLAAVGAVAKLTAGTGGAGSTDRAKYINVATPFLQYVHNNAVGAKSLVRADRAANRTQFHAEITADAFNSNANSHLYAGFDDRSLDLNAGTTGFISTANMPGGTGGVAGISLDATKASTSVTLFRNGGTQTLTLPNAIGAGDAFAFDVDTTAHTIKITFWHSGTATVLNSGSVITLTSHIPATWWLVAGGANGTGTQSTSDSGTFNPSASTGHVTPTSGYGNYA